MVAPNYRSPRHHGGMDLIGWNNDVLCFIEVKTPTTPGLKAAEVGFDREKRRAISYVFGDDSRSLPRRQFPEPPPCRFDVDDGLLRKTEGNPQFEVFQNAALSS